MLNAFCRVAPSVRFSTLAIFFAGAFLRAADFNVRTSAVVQERRFFPFFIRISNMKADASSGKRFKRKAPRRCGEAEFRT
jgi:hypothetical protein